MIDVTEARLNEYRESGQNAFVILIKGARQDNGYDMVFRTHVVGTWTSRPSTSGVYSDRIPVGGLGDLVNSVDEQGEGGCADVGRASFKLDNSDGWLELIIGPDKTFIIEGKGVEIWIHAAGDDDTTSWGAAQRIWGGVITDTRFVNMVLEVECETVDRYYHRQIPPNLFERGDNTAWDAYSIPEALNGTPVPLVFGEVKRAKGYVVADTYDTGSADAGRGVKFCDSSFTPLQVRSIADLAYGLPGMVDANGGYAKVWEPNTGYTVMANAGFAYFDDLIGIDEDDPTISIEFEIWFRSWLANADNVIGVSNSIYAIDGSDLTKADIPAATSGVTDAKRNVVVKTPDMGLSGTINGLDTDTASIWALVKLTSSSGFTYTSSSEYEAVVITYLRGPNNGVAASSSPSWAWGNTSGNANNLDIDNTAPGHANRYSYRLNNLLNGLTYWSQFKPLTTLQNGFFAIGTYAHGGGAGPTGSLDVYKFGIVVQATVPLPDDDLYATMEGFNDIGGNYTGTSGSLIENPADMLAAIWCRLTNCAASDYVIDSLSRARAARSGWRMGRQLLERKDSRDYLDELGKQSLMWSWVDSAGDVRLFPLTPSVSGEPEHVITPEETVGGVDAAYRYDNAHVQTSFTFKYGWNPVADDYDGLIKCSSSESHPDLGSTYEDLCSDAKSYYTGGQERELDDVELSWIEDHDTAVAYAKAIINRRTRRPWIVEFTADIGSLFFLELGDPFRFSKSEAWDTYMPAAARDLEYRVTRVSLSPSSGQLQIVGTEVFSDA